MTACPCGAGTTETQAVCGNALLTFDRCMACGRCGGYCLRVRGTGALISRDQEAKREFLSMGKPSVERVQGNLFQ